MTERLNLVIVGVLAAVLVLAGYFAFLGHVAEAKEIAMVIASGLVGAIGGHAVARNATQLPENQTERTDP